MFCPKPCSSRCSRRHLVLLLWKRKPSLLRSTAIGLLLSYACLVRTSGAILIVPVVVFPCRHARRLEEGGLVCGRVLGSDPRERGLVRRHLWDVHYVGLDGYSCTPELGPSADCSRLSLPKPERYLCPKVPVMSAQAHLGLSVDPSPAVKLRARSPKPSTRPKRDLT